MGAALYGQRMTAAATQAHHFASSIKSRKEVPLGDSKREAPVIDPAAPVTWYAIITAPRAETKAEKGLREAGFVHIYVPRLTYWVSRTLYRHTTRYECQRALFPRYLFLGFEEVNHWYGLETIDGITGVMCNDGKACPIPAKCLAPIAEQEREGWFDERRRPLLERAAGPILSAGDQIRITGEGNPFVSFPAIVAEDTSSDVVRIEIAIFGRLTPMVVPISDVEVTQRATRATL
jgi:transcription antitermination factor NusG